MKISAIVVAGGSSNRFGNKNKLLEFLCGKEVIFHSIETILSFENVFELVISASEDVKAFLKTSKYFSKIENFDKIKIISGGKVRQESVFNALKACSIPDFVLIHDAARPLVKRENILECFENAKKNKASILAVNSIDTIKIVDKNFKIIETPDRNKLFNVQTPQIFDYNLILNAHKKLEGQNVSDDAGMLEKLEIPVYITQGDYSNIKITTLKDIEIAQKLLNGFST